MSNIIGKNIIYASLEMFIPGIITIIFWLVAGNVSNTESLGIASVIATLVVIISTISSLDVHFGMKRYLGIAIADNNIEDFTKILVYSLLIVGIMIIVSNIIITIPSLSILDVLGIGYDYYWIIIAMLSSATLNLVFSQALISALKSKSLIVPLVIGAGSRIPLLLFFVIFLDLPTLGIIGSYAIMFFVVSIGYGLTLLKFCTTKLQTPKDFTKTVRNILKASFAGWIPKTVNIMGTQLGVLVIFANTGASATGKFYIPFIIFVGTLFLVSGITKVGHSYIAGINDLQKEQKFVKYTMKMGFMFTVPIASCLLFFSEEVLAIISNTNNSEYLTLSIFMLAIPLEIISLIIFYTVYGKGEHKTVLLLGLIGNIPRLFLYFVLVPEFGVIGGSVSYLAGSICQVIGSHVVSNRKNMELDYKKYFVITIIPFIIGFLVSQYIPFVISILLILVGSFLIYIKLNLFSEKDLQNLTYLVLPKNKSDIIYPKLQRIFKIIN